MDKDSGSVGSSVDDADAPISSPLRGDGEMPPSQRSRDLRRERGNASRVALRMATIASVARHGLAGTTLATVAAIAGVSRALVGFHFKSKDQLLTEALETSLALYDDSLQLAMTTAGPTPQQRLEAMMMHDLHFVPAHPDLLSMWCAIWGEARGVDLYRTSVLPSDRQYRDDAADVLTEILGDRAAAERHARILQAFVFGVWLDYHLDPDRFDIGAVEDAARVLMTPGQGLSLPAPASR